MEGNIELGLNSLKISNLSEMTLNSNNNDYAELKRFGHTFTLSKFIY